jgi:hypothetical protein
MLDPFVFNGMRCKFGLRHELFGLVWKGEMTRSKGEVQ